MIGKTHGHLLRDMDSYRAILTESNFGFSDFFQESTYKDSTGRMLSYNQVTKKTCELIAHKFTDKKGILFIEAYINWFYTRSSHVLQRSANLTERGFSATMPTRQASEKMVISPCLFRILMGWG